MALFALRTGVRGRLDGGKAAAWRCAVSAHSLKAKRREEAAAVLARGISSSDRGHRYAASAQNGKRRVWRRSYAHALLHSDGRRPATRASPLTLTPCCTLCRAPATLHSCSGAGALPLLARPHALRTHHAIALLLAHARVFRRGWYMRGTAACALPPFLFLHLPGCTGVYALAKPVKYRVTAGWCRTVDGVRLDFDGRWALWQAGVVNGRQTLVDVPFQAWTTLWRMATAAAAWRLGICERLEETATWIKRRRAAGMVGVLIDAIPYRHSLPPYTCLALHHRDAGRSMWCCM